MRKPYALAKNPRQPRRERATWSRLSILLALVIAAFALTASPASALQVHVFESAFGESGSGDGQLELAAHSGLAVNDTTGDVYVADTNNHRIVEFSESGAFIRAFGANVGGAGIDVCTTGCAAGTSTSAAGGFEAPLFAAIDNSGGASDGDVYVADAAAKLVSKFEEDGTLVTAWGTGGQLDGSSATGGPFTEIAGIAVDGEGNLDALEIEPHLLFRFDETGAFLGEIETPRGSEPGGLAVDAEGHFFKVNGSLTVEKIEGSGTDVGEVNNSFSTQGIAVDTSDSNLFVDTGSAIQTYAFEPSGEVVGTGCTPASFAGCPPTNTFGSGDLASGAGLAVDSATHTVYAADVGAGKIVAFKQLLLPDVTTEEATPIAAESATLHGTISAAEGPPASCEFQYTTKQAFDEHGFEGAQSAGCSPAGPFTGNGAEPVSAEVEGLAVGTTYFFRLVGSSENGTTPELTSKTGALSFRTGGPAIVASSATEITATAAKINGLIDTNGEPTTFHVEYGPTAGYGSSAPVPDALAEVPIGTGNFEPGSKTIFGVKMSQGAFAVGQRVVAEGIPPGTTVTKIEGSTLTLSAFTEFGFGFGFEIPLTSDTAAISQRLKGLTPDTQYHFRIVATGGATASGPDRTFSTFAQEPPTSRSFEMVSPPQKLGEVFAPEPEGQLGGTCELCLPGTEDGMMPFQATADGDSLAFEGQPFSSELPPGGNQYISRRAGGGWATVGITPPLATAGRDDGGQSGFKAFSADLSRGVLYQSERALSPEAPVGDDGHVYNNLYLWEAGLSGLRPLVTVTPPHRTARNPAAAGSFQLAFAGGNSGTGADPAFTHLVFEANDALTPPVPGIAPAAPETGEVACGLVEAHQFPEESDCNLYEWVGGSLRLINVLPGDETAADHAVIGSGRRLALETPNRNAANVDRAISADGSRIFWSDGSGQVYIRIDGKETVEVHDPGQFLTATPDGSKALLNDGCIYDVAAEHCDGVLGNSSSAFLGIMGASEDLSRIYFLDTEALAPGAQPESCIREVGAGNGCNLYVYDSDSIRFIATLNQVDGAFNFIGTYGAWTAAPSNRTAQVSPDGRYLAFMSTASLTGSDNRVAAGSACSILGAPCFEVYEYDLEQGLLHCASCNPTGQRPLEGSNLSLIRPHLGENNPQAPFAQLENLPAGGEGRLFFESRDALSVKDTNGRIQDVYEWTPNGVGDCDLVSGCVALVSSGHSANDSMFVTATPDARNAFFVTREQLLPQDQDELLDIYDARVGGGFEGAESAPCDGESCRAPASPPPQQSSSGSSLFSGPGNLRSRHHRKHHRKHHHRKKHHGKKSHHRSRAARANRGGVK